MTGHWSCTLRAHSDTTGHWSPSGHTVTRLDTGHPQGTQWHNWTLVTLRTHSDIIAVTSLITGPNPAFQSLALRSWGRRRRIAWEGEGRREVRGKGYAVTLSYTELLRLPESFSPGWQIIRTMIYLQFQHWNVYTYNDAMKTHTMQAMAKFRI